VHPRTIMKKPGISASQEKEARELISMLEQHWQHRYRPDEIRNRIMELLGALKLKLEQNTADTRFVVSTYQRLQRHLALDQEVELANQVLKRMVAELSTVVVSILPFALVTLPRIFSLAGYFGIDLLPDEMHGKPEADAPDVLPSS